MTAQRHDTLGYQTVDVMIDIDDVVVPWFETVDRLCVETWGESPNGPCRVWSMHEHYGRTREEWEDIVIRATHEGLYTHVDPLPYAAEAVRRLRWHGHRPHIVTARGFMANGENIRRWTKEYLERFAIPYETLTFAKNKARAMEALGLRFDYAIDDGIHNFEVLDEAGVPVYLQTAPHNLHYEAPEGRRVDSLWQFVDMVLERTTPFATHKEHP